MELPVIVPSVATLRLLWLVHISKGVFSVEWPARMSRDERVELVLRVGARRLLLPGQVKSCVPSNGRFHLNLTLDPLTDVLCHEFESALSMEDVARY
ncbi:MAG: hypothetical protein JWN44_4398 [Myxococcales bacterium]|nr:hypothetical protein [Myxococcales bacterium]